MRSCYQIRLHKKITNLLRYAIETSKISNFCSCHTARSSRDRSPVQMKFQKVSTLLNRILETLAENHTHYFCHIFQLIFFDQGDRSTLHKMPLTVNLNADFFNQIKNFKEQGELKFGNTIPPVTHVEKSLDRWTQLFLQCFPLTFWPKNISNSNSKYFVTQT